MIAEEAVNFKSSKILLIVNPNSYLSIILLGPSL